MREKEIYRGKDAKREGDKVRGRDRERKRERQRETERDRGGMAVREIHFHKSLRVVQQLYKATNLFKLQTSAVRMKKMPETKIFQNHSDGVSKK